MKRIVQVSLILGVMLFFTACGAIPTENLTASISLNQTNSNVQENNDLELAATACEGILDPESNLLRISFELATNEDVFGNGGAEQRFLFGGGTALMASVPTNSDSNLRFRCEGASSMTIMPLQVNNKPVAWAAALQVPQLKVELPNGETRNMENAFFHGMIATSPEELSIMFETLFGMNPGSGYRAFFAAQKALYVNYPDEAFMRNMAINSGLSENNANRLGQLYVEQNVANQQQLLVDILTFSEDEAYAEVVIGSTVQTLLVMGLQPDTISKLFQEATDGRVTVQFDSEAMSVNASEISVQTTERNGDESVTYTASSSQSGSSSSSSNSGSSPSNDDGSTGGGADDGNTGGGTDDGNTGGGTDDGNTGGGTDDGNTGGGTDDPKTNPFEKLLNILWGALKGAAEGAVLGGIAGSPFGPGGSAVGGAIGAVIGGAYGGYNAGKGVYDPNPNDPGGPCKSPIVFC